MGPLMEVSKSNGTLKIGSASRPHAAAPAACGAWPCSLISRCRPCAASSGMSARQRSRLQPNQAEPGVHAAAQGG